MISDKLRRFGAFAALLLLASCSTATPFADRTSFASPRGAVEQLVAALRADDVERLTELFGQDSAELLSSGDTEADRLARRSFLEQYEEAHAIEEREDGTAIVLIGREEWPFPIPIVRQGEAWYLDTAEGLEELIDRRIGRNELAVMQTLLAFVDAQREYVREDWDGDGVFEYAQRIRSTPGTKDGLYWPSHEGEGLSPTGELLALAEASDRAEGAYHGYLFRLLSAQGSHAGGGGYRYLAGEHMIGGFAVVAYPLSYRESGVASFMISHNGVLYEKDLGEDGAKKALSMSVFDSDDTWWEVRPADLGMPSS